MMFLMVLLAGSLAPISTDPSPSIDKCEVPAGTKSFKRLSEVPAEIRSDLVKFEGILAERDQAIQKYDNIKEPSLPRRRFVGGFYSNNIWAILYENGEDNSVRAIRFSPSGYTKKLGRINGTALVGEVCPLITATLSGIIGINSHRN